MSPHISTSGRPASGWETIANAIRAYLQASQRESGHRDALLRLGICYERVREPAAARSFYRKFLGLESNGPRAELVRARLDALVSAPST